MSMSCIALSRPAARATVFPPVRNRAHGISPVVRIEAGSSVWPRNQCGEIHVVAVPADGVSVIVAE